MNRREFLAVAGATAAVGLAPKARAQDKLRCGLLGIDHAHAIDALRVLQASPDFEVVGVCEPDAAIREQVSKRKELNGVPWLSKAELLGDESIAMIAVESGVQRLIPLAQEAVDAGKHIHLDKPAGTSLEAFARVQKAAAQHGKLIQMGYMFRYNPGFDFVRNAVKEGWLGEVYSIDASMCTDLGADKRERIGFHPGGVMLELGCHLIDMIHLVMGPPKSVQSFLRHDGPFDDTLADNTLAVLQYDNAMVKVEVGAMEPMAFAGRRFKVVGTKGSMTLEPLEPPHGFLRLKEAAGEYVAGDHEIVFDDLDRHVRDFADLAACIRGEKTFAYTPDHDYAVERTILQACGEDV